MAVPVAVPVEPVTWGNINVPLVWKISRSRAEPDGARIKPKQQAVNLAAAWLPPHRRLVPTVCDQRNACVDLVRSRPVLGQQLNIGVAGVLGESCDLGR
jgi:hypothetical protein